MLGLSAQKSGRICVCAGKLTQGFDSHALDNSVIERLRAGLAADRKLDMDCKNAALLAIAILAALLCPAAIAQSPEAGENAYIVKAPIGGLPAGPFSQWTEEQRQSAFGRVRGFCQFLCVDKYGNAAFPDKHAAQRIAAEAKVCLGACIAGHLPLDYPRIAELTKQLHADYDEARKLGSTIPWPLPGR